MRTFTLMPLLITLMRELDVDGSSRMLTADVVVSVVPTGTDSLTASPLSSTGVSSSPASALEHATREAAERAITRSVRVVRIASESFMAVLAGEEM
jgi:hypothetical protein